LLVVVVVVVVTAAVTFVSGEKTEYPKSGHILYKTHESTGY